MRSRESGLGERVRPFVVEIAEQRADRDQQVSAIGR